MATMAANPSRDFVYHLCSNNDDNDDDAEDWRSIFGGEKSKVLSCFVAFVVLCCGFGIRWLSGLIGC